jgi:glycosyltransferase involved in cell wall biosynthesis
MTVRHDTAKRSGLAVSVLIKAFNHASYVRRTITSILEQSFQDFELVVTDDASTDATAEIVREFADPRVRLEVLPRNQGISGAMNATIARARGSYFAILNSDDWALPGRLERQVSFLDEHPGVSLLFGVPVPVGEAGARTEAHHDFNQCLTLPDYSRGAWLRQFFFKGNCLCAPTAMIRREAYEAAGSYDRRLTNLQDLDMWIRMLVAGHDIHVLPEALTAFRIRADNANMSAPRPDTQLRSMFEAGKILRHFAAFDAPLFQEVFSDVATTPLTDHRHRNRLLAELALRDPRLAYQNFALEILYDTARDTDDFDRLRSAAGCADVLGARTIQELCGSLTKQQEAIAALTEALAGKDRHLAEMEREIMTARETIRRLSN